MVSNKVSMYHINTGSMSVPVQQSAFIKHSFNRYDWTSPLIFTHQHTILLHFWGLLNCPLKAQISKQSQCAVVSWFYAITTGWVPLPTLKCQCTSHIMLRAAGSRARWESAINTQHLVRVFYSETWAAVSRHLVGRAWRAGDVWQRAVQRDTRRPWTHRQAREAGSE